MHVQTIQPFDQRLAEILAEQREDLQRREAHEAAWASRERANDRGEITPTWEEVKQAQTVYHRAYDCPARKARKEEMFRRFPDLKEQLRGATQATRRKALFSVYLSLDRASQDAVDAAVEEAGSAASREECAAWDALSDANRDACHAYYDQRLLEELEKRGLGPRKDETMNATIINSAGGEPAEGLSREKRGALYHAGELADVLYHNVWQAEQSLYVVPGILEQILDGELWRELLIEHLGRVYSHDTFTEFVTASAVGGLDTTLDTLRRLCRDHPDVLAKLEAQIERERS
jgi:hypothetical protein